MAEPGIQFCDICQRSIPANRGTILPNGAVYCRECTVLLLTNE